MRGLGGVGGGGGGGGGGQGRGGEDKGGGERREEGGGRREERREEGGGGRVVGILSRQNRIRQKMQLLPMLNVNPLTFPTLTSYRRNPGV